jgi:hypothetical protein
MKKTIIAAVGFAVFLRASTPAHAAPTAFNITVPLTFGQHRARESEQLTRPSDVRAERRLRLLRYAFQIADAVVSAIGYHAYAKCLSCLAYPGGGPMGSTSFTVANLAGNRPAEVDPLVQPLSHGGVPSLALGALAFDVIDARIERHWSVERREAADLAEIGAHAWGITSWLPEIKNIHRDTAIAAACGAQWRAKNYGEAFSDGCVNEYYRSSGNAAPHHSSPQVMTVCAPARFAPGAYLVQTSTTYVVASGTPCGDNLSSPFP